MQKNCIVPKNHDAVEGVWYPEGELASRQMKRGGGVISFQLKAGKKRRRRLLMTFTLLQLR